MRLSLFLRQFIRRERKIPNNNRYTRNSGIIEKDHIRLLIRAGSGGNGILRYNGIGGTGGSVYARPLNNLTFDQFWNKYAPTDEGTRRELAAEHGEQSKQIKLVGKNGKDLIIDVPLGVEVIGNKNSLLLARCNNNRQRYLLASGGKGGCAANGFKGEIGERVWVTVQLKLHPNIGLIGYPNAGKSTLMKALVPEKDIEIADYPFTTKRPQLCYIKYKQAEQNDEEEYAGSDLQMQQSPPTLTDDKIINEQNQHQHQRGSKKKPFSISLSIADLPGIVEGAANNVYGGLTCLRHLEYSEIILMIVDVHGFRLSPSEPLKTPLETIAHLNREMEAYDRKMASKPVILLLNKVDIEDGQKIGDDLCNFFIHKQGGWSKELPEAIRPRYPIVFQSVHAVSAKQAKLGNVRERLAEIHSALNPVKKQKFAEDDRGMGEGKNTKILI